MSVNNLTLPHDGTGRGSGKTYKQVAALPDEATFIVNSGMRRHIMGVLTSQGRSTNCLRIVEVAGRRDAESLRGLRGSPYAFDHDVFEKLPDKVIKYIQLIMDG